MIRLSLLNFYLFKPTLVYLRERIGVGVHVEWDDVGVVVLVFLAY